MGPGVTIVLQDERSHERGLMDHKAASQSMQHW